MKQTKANHESNVNFNSTISDVVEHSTFSQTKSIVISYIDILILRFLLNNLV